MTRRLTMMHLPQLQAIAASSQHSATPAGADKLVTRFQTAPPSNYSSFVACQAFLFAVCRTGGPLAWKSIRQNQTALSSCEAEIVATNECTTELQSLRYRDQDLGMSDAFERTTVYNDNKAAVDWAAACTNKGTKHINLRENYIRELHQSGITKVTHIPGVVNASDLFTKELKDQAHFRRCRDSFMVSLTNFNTSGHILPSHHQNKEDLPYYSIRSPLILEKSRPTGPLRGRSRCASSGSHH